MSAQLVRMNAAASNLANAGNVADSEDGAYRPLRPVFAEQLDRASGLSTVNVQGVYRSSEAPIREHNPDHPLADANGDVWTSPVDENAEMVEMLDSSRRYQNLVEALSSAKQLMLETMRMK
jgi:flagellar basal-body rod protein FlgC